MFITNALTPTEMLSELFRLPEADPEDTGYFRQLRHNTALCPRFRRQLKALRNVYLAHSVDVHEIQGMRDKGSDVVLRFDKPDAGTEIAALQIKSYHEIRSSFRKKSGQTMVGQLRAQYAQATQNSEVGTWYIVLCTDAVEHADFVKQVRTEFHEWKKLRVVDPQQALPFYKMAEYEIEAFCTRRLCSDDLVLLAARGELNSLSPLAGHLAIALVQHAFSEGPMVSEEWLQAEASQFERDYSLGGDLASSMGELRDLLEMKSDGYGIKAQEMPALCAIYFDQIVRYSKNGGNLVQFLGILLSAGAQAIADDNDENDEEDWPD